MPRHVATAIAAGVVSIVVFALSIRAWIPAALREPVPLEALRRAEASSEYDEPFWLGVRQHDAGLWRTAEHFCLGRDLSRHPNCAPVLRILFLRRDVRRERGSSEGTVPELDWKQRQLDAQERLRALATPAPSVP